MVRFLCQVCLARFVVAGVNHDENWSEHGHPKNETQTVLRDDMYELVAKCHLNNAAAYLRLNQPQQVIKNCDKVRDIVFCVRRNRACRKRSCPVGDHLLFESITRKKLKQLELKSVEFTRCPSTPTRIFRVMIQCCIRFRKPLSMCACTTIHCIFMYCSK